MHVWLTALNGGSIMLCLLACALLLQQMRHTFTTRAWFTVLMLVLAVHVALATYTVIYACQHTQIVGLWLGSYSLLGPILIGCLHLSSGAPITRLRLAVYVLPASGLLLWALMALPRRESIGWYALVSVLLALQFFYLMYANVWVRRSGSALGQASGALVWLSRGLALSWLPFALHQLGFANKWLSILAWALCTLGLHIALLPQRSPRRKRQETTSPTQHSPALTAALAYMHTQRPYLDPELTLPKLAQQLQLRPNQLSQLLNQELHCSFNDWVNGYRLAHAQALLQAPDQQHIKIASIAFEAGFGTLSTFNAVFKAQLGCTPSAYRRQFVASSTTETTLSVA